MTTLAAYVRQLSTPLDPLTRRERLFYWACLVAIGLTRIYARSRSPIDWDETLFCSATREYDVVPHHPHPPGYPLFILAAKALRLFMRDDFQALRSVATIAAVLLFPVFFALVRELRMPTRVAFGAAILTAFIPTVWYYGGTALSDVPALVSVIAASALLLRGGRSDEAFVAGMFVLGIAGGIRPQHVLIAMPLFLLAVAANRRVRTIVAGCVVAVLVTCASYAGAALNSSDPPHGYIKQVRGTADYIGETDSYRNPARKPLRALAADFFVTPHRGGRVGLVMFALTALALLESVMRRRPALWVIFLMFAPTAVVSWLMFDTTGLTRYAVAYAAMYAIGTAYALDLVAPRFVYPVATAAIAAALVIWTLPALKVVREQLSPPVAAMQWIRIYAPSAGSRLFMTDGLSYHAAYRLPEYDRTFFTEYRQIPDDAYAPGNYCVIERITVQPCAKVFRFARTRLAEIARASYFEISLVPMNAMIRFAEGWYQDEYDAENRWRWMGQRSRTLFPPLPGTGELHLRFFAPLNTMPHPPTMTLTWNGAVIDRSRIGESVERDFRLASRAGRPNELRIELDTASRPRELGLTDDTRDFGLQLIDVRWERVDGIAYAF